MVFDNFFSFFDNFFSSFLSAPIQSYPLLTIVVLSFVITFIATIIYKWFTDQNLMKSLKEDTKKLQEEAKQHKDNPAKMMEIQKQAMDKNMKYMMHSFKPTLITILPIGLLITWLGKAYKGIDLNFLGFIDSWIWTYIIISVIASILIRKILKVH